MYSNAINSSVLDATQDEKLNTNDETVIDDIEKDQVNDDDDKLQPLLEEGCSEQHFETQKLPDLRMPSLSE